MKGISYLLEVLDIAEKNQPRYNFLIYNASLVMWEVGRPLLKEDTAKHCIECFTRMCDLLEKINFEDKCWRAKYQMALFTAYTANGTKDKSMNCIKTGIALVQNEKSEEAQYILNQLNYMAVYIYILFIFRLYMVVVKEVVQLLHHQEIKCIMK